MYECGDIFLLPSDGINCKNTNTAMSFVHAAYTCNYLL